MSEFARWLPYIGVITDDERGLRAVIPVIGTEVQEARANLLLAVAYIERGTPLPGSLGIAKAFRDIRDGADANEALGLKLPRGTEKSQRPFWIAVDTIIEHTLSRSKLWKDAHRATADAWAEEGLDSVKAAKLDNAEKAGELLSIWIRWAREVEGISGRTDEEILLAYLHGIRATAHCYPPGQNRRGRKKGN